MCAARLKIVARNARTVPRDDCELFAINIYELNLSDEHMAHVYRFRGCEPFDRGQWERMRGYCAWKRAVFTGEKTPPIAEPAWKPRNG